MGLISNDICKELTDLEIVQKSLIDVDYFICLFEKYESKLMRYIRRLSLVNDEEAEDILQDSFVKIWKNLNGFDTSLKLSSWLYRIVHNQTISHWRKKTSYGKNNVVSIDEQLFVTDEEDMDSFDEIDDSNNKLNYAIQNLSVNYREIIILRFFDGMSYIEISDVLKIPEGTVAIRISRAKKALLKKYMG